MKIYRVTDGEFSRYGRVLSADTSEIVKTAEKIPMPDEGSIYKPSLAEFEALEIMNTVKNEYFGEMPTQLGYCYGHSNQLNALEWHKCSEINIAITDLILLLGDLRDVEEGGRYDSSKVKAFKLKKGEIIEVYATTLHFCPIETSKSGFGCVVGLTQGTNTPLDAEPKDKFLFRKNKWLIAHVENTDLINRGAAAGIYGENIKLCGEEL